MCKFQPLFIIWKIWIVNRILSNALVRPRKQAYAGFPYFRFICVIINNACVVNLFFLNSYCSFLLVMYFSSFAFKIAVNSLSSGITCVFKMSWNSVVNSWVSYLPLYIKNLLGILSTSGVFLFFSLLNACTTFDLSIVSICSLFSTSCFVSSSELLKVFFKLF